MGYILSKSEGASEKVYAEMRRESFVLFTDFGEDRIELRYELLPHLIQAAQAIQARRKAAQSTPSEATNAE